MAVFALVTTRNEVGARLYFSQASVILLMGGACGCCWGRGAYMHGCSGGGMCGCSGGGACVVAPVGGQHAWLLPGGSMHGCSGGCVVAPRGHAWLLLGGCAWLLPSGGGVHGCSGGAAHMVALGACVVAPRGACMVAPGGVCVVALGGGHEWDTRYGDTINERAVRILLECILVNYTLTKLSKSLSLVL